MTEFSTTQAVMYRFFACQIDEVFSGLVMYFKPLCFGGDHKGPGTLDCSSSTIPSILKGMGRAFDHHSWDNPLDLIEPMLCHAFSSSLLEVGTV